MLYMVTWIPSIYPSHVSINLPAPAGSVMGLAFIFWRENLPAPWFAGRGSSTMFNPPQEIRWNAAGLPWCAQANFLQDLMQRTGLVDAMGPEKQTPLMWVTGMKKPWEIHEKKMVPPCDISLRPKPHGNAGAFLSEE